MEDKKFIVVKDIDSKENLLKCGLTLISKSYGEWIFINDRKLMSNFNIDNAKFRMTDKLNI